MSALKLFALPTSPFAARLHIQIREKDLDIATEFPAPGVSPAIHGALNPFARTPILLDGDNVLIESAVIAEYLEDLYPEPCLRGNSPLKTAQIRAFIRAVDLYLFPLMFRLRSCHAGDAALQPTMAELNQVLSGLEALFIGQGYAVAGQMTLADCALLPACFYLDFFLGRLQQDNFRSQHPLLANWWLLMLQHRSVETVVTGLSEALKSPR